MISSSPQRTPWSSYQECVNGSSESWCQLLGSVGGHGPGGRKAMREESLFRSQRLKCDTHIPSLSLPHGTCRVLWVGFLTLGELRPSLELLCLRWLDVPVLKDYFNNSKQPLGQLQNQQWKHGPPSIHWGKVLKSRDSGVKWTSNSDAAIYSLCDLGQAT